MDIKQTIRRQNLEDIEHQAHKVAGMMERIRVAMLAPTATKTAPTLKAVQLAELCGVDKSKIAYRLTRGDLPSGEIHGNSREWTMAEAQAWARELRADHLRPDGAAGITITVANFKGGVAKTTSAVTLAQGLSMRGHKVLLLDLDPQGSATTLFGVLPDAEVETEHTAMSLFTGEQDNLQYAIRPTYWPNIDLVCAAPLLYGAEFHLPARQARDAGFEFWRVLDRGLDLTREAYDVIVIDTPPSLSYVTINALMAADGVIMPCPFRARLRELGPVLGPVLRPVQPAGPKPRQGQELRVHRCAVVAGRGLGHGQLGGAPVGARGLRRQGAADRDPEDRGGGDRQRGVRNGL